MNRLRKVEGQIQAIMDYLGIDLVEKNGWEAVEHKKEMGFCEKKK